mgnify:CR=1 FL=1|tara:strand:+ start:653 stop:1627 length:975 start_codon:yes stop_codon:yes gene_type:complete
MKFFNKNILSYVFVILITFISTWYFITNDKNKLVYATEKSIASVVTISSTSERGYKGKRNEIGSGVIFSDDGYIVTNLHILKGQNIEVGLKSGKVLDAKIIGFDENSDLAVLKISPEEEIYPINFANSEHLKIGDKVLAIGNPYGIGISVSSGIISATGRDYGNPYLQLIQTDAAINPGNSGGALINENGNLIGINSKIFSKTGAYQGIGFAIPSNLVVQIATQLIKYGKINTLWIGNFRVSNVKLKRNNRIIDGLRIIELDEIGPLYEKGIRVNDIILKINGQNGSWNNLVQSMKFATLGEKLQLEFYSNDEGILMHEFKYED